MGTGAKTSVGTQPRKEAPELSLTSRGGAQLPEGEPSWRSPRLGRVLPPGALPDSCTEYQRKFPSFFQRERHERNQSEMLCSFQQDLLSGDNVLPDSHLSGFCWSLTPQEKGTALPHCLWPSWLTQGDVWLSRQRQGLAQGLAH